jgi:hypothetical protein
MATITSVLKMIDVIEIKIDIRAVPDIKEMDSVSDLAAIP